MIVGLGLQASCVCKLHVASVASISSSSSVHRAAGVMAKAIRKKPTACQEFAAGATVFQKRMPFDIMRHILTFKDPTKQVGVRGGIKTPSCVFYSWKQRNSAPDGAMVIKAYQTNVCVFKNTQLGILIWGLQTDTR